MRHASALTYVEVRTLTLTLTLILAAAPPEHVGHALRTYMGEKKRGMLGRLKKPH